MSDDERDAGEEAGVRSSLASFQTQVVESNSASMRRAENIQLLISLGVLGLAGTLFAQGIIEFPILADASSSTSVRWSFRILVYSTALFLFGKLLTSTIYPTTDSKSLIFIHEWVEPFIYVFSSVLFVLLSLGVIISQNAPISLANIVGIPLVSIISVIIALLYSKQVASRYGSQRKLERSAIADSILIALSRDHDTEMSRKKDSLFSEVSITSNRSKYQSVLQELLKDDSIPIDEVGTESVRITDSNKMVHTLQDRDIPMSNIRYWFPDYIKPSGSANPESDNERTYFCNSCKKHFAESEMTDSQVQNSECPECYEKLSLQSDPAHRNRSHP